MRITATERQRDILPDMSKANIISRLSVFRRKSLGKLAAHIAIFQMQNGRHWFSEHPLGSEMYLLDEWRWLMDNFDVKRTVVDQCMLGLVGVRTGLPIKKSTDFRASDERLLARFENCRCDGTHRHARLGNWPKPGEDAVPVEVTSKNLATTKRKPLKFIRGK